MRITAAQYRAWTLDEWCEHVRALEVSSLTAWANRSHTSYKHAVTLGCQRDVARRLGWLPKLEKGEMERMTDDEFVVRFRNRDVHSISDMWRAAQHWCEYLRLLDIEDQLLFRNGPEVYLDHVFGVFSAAGIPLTTRIGGGAALRFENLAQKPGEDD